MNFDLKFAILKTGTTQRAVGLLAHIPETRLSEIVRGRVAPSATERAALTRILGQDYFTNATRELVRQ